MATRLRNLLERRAWSWRWLLNYRRALPYRVFDQWQAFPPPELRALYQDGIVIRPIGELLGAAGQAYFAAARQAAADALADPAVDQFLRAGGSAAARKAFRMALLPDELPADSPFLWLGLDPTLLALANAYLGMRAMLRAVTVWLDVPTAGPPTETQLWHRDDDDYSNVKVLIYLNDVSEATGPFCYIPRTQPCGTRRLPRGLERQERVTDAEMEAVVPAQTWQKCTGAAGTVVVADTRGYHKGLQPQGGHRRLLLLQYTSGRPRYPRTLRVPGPHSRALTSVQRWALAG